MVVKIVLVKTPPSLVSMDECGRKEKEGVTGANQQTTPNELRSEFTESTSIKISIIFHTIVIQTAGVPLAPLVLRVYHQKATVVTDSQAGELACEIAWCTN